MGRTLKIAAGLLVALGGLGAASLGSKGRTERSFARTDAPQAHVAALDVPEEPSIATTPAMFAAPEPEPEPEPSPEPAAAPPADANGKASFARRTPLRGDDAASASARVTPERSPEGQAATVLGGSAESASSDDFASLPEVDTE